MRNNEPFVSESSLVGGVGHVGLILYLLSGAKEQLYWLGKNPESALARQRYRQVEGTLPSQT
jgi:hypothetical protein